MITTFCRGWKIYFDGTVWRYIDNNEECKDQRPCKKCGHYPTSEGYDHCQGYINGAISACCGHGVENKYIIMGEK